MHRLTINDAKKPLSLAHTIRWADLASKGHVGARPLHAGVVMPH